MKIGVSLKIDVTKIEKARLFEGKQGKYLDAVVFIDTQPDQYGNNGMITQSVSKDEKEKGVKGSILGNSKIIYFDEGQNQQSSSRQQAQIPPQRQGSMKDHAPQGAPDDFGDDIPFMRLSSSYAIG